VNLPSGRNGPDRHNCVKDFRYLFLLNYLSLGKWSPLSPLVTICVVLELGILLTFMLTNSVSARCWTAKMSHYRKFDQRLGYWDHLSNHHVTFLTASPFSTKIKVAIKNLFSLIPPPRLDAQWPKFPRILSDYITVSSLLPKTHHHRERCSSSLRYSCPQTTPVFFFFSSSTHTLYLTRLGLIRDKYHKNKLSRVRNQITLAKKAALIQLICGNETGCANECFLELLEADLKYVREKKWNCCPAYHPGV
jgi:hypothetical protein